MKGVLDLVPDLRKHKGIVLGMLKNGAAFVLPDGYEAAPSADNLGYAVCVLTGNQDSEG